MDCSNNLETYLKGFATDKVDVVIYDSKRKIAAATNYSANTVGLCHGFELIGYSYAEISNNDLLRLCKTEYLTQYKNEILQLCDYVHNILGNAMKTGRIMRYLDSIPYRNVDYMLMVTLIPIFEKTKVVGLYSISDKFHPYGIHDFFNNTNGITESILNKCDGLLPLNLTPQQHAVLFLALHGYTQTEIADILGVARGTIAATFRDSLCKKFNIKSGSMKVLLKHLSGYGIARIFPSKLFKPQIILQA